LITVKPGLPVNPRDINEKMKYDSLKSSTVIEKAMNVLSDAERETFVNMTNRLYKNIADIIDEKESNTD
jgi:hypothetical protein